MNSQLTFSMASLPESNRGYAVARSAVQGPLALVLMTLAVSQIAAPEFQPIEGVRIAGGVQATGRSSSVSSEVSIETMVSALQGLAKHLAEHQAELDPVAKHVLYRDLWDLYD